MSLLSKIRRISKQKGIRYLPAAAYRKIRVKAVTSFEYNYFKFFKSEQPFMFQGKKLKYFYHKYNTTWRNERAVEIPIVWDKVKNFQGTILEVGNVLSNYFPIQHDIVDKYEKANGVTNEDVTEISTSKKYDLIVSISTLEHVGWDEDPRKQFALNEKQKIAQSVDKLKTLLNPMGKIVATVPVGYNPNLDTLLRNNQTGFDKIFCLKRVSKDNRWVEAQWKDIANSKFNSPFPFANGLVVGIVEKA